MCSSEPACACWQPCSPSPSPAPGTSRLIHWRLLDMFHFLTQVRSGCGSAVWNTLPLHTELCCWDCWALSSAAHTTKSWLHWLEARAREGLCRNSWQLSLPFSHSFSAKSVEWDQTRLYVHTHAYVHPAAHIPLHASAFSKGKVPSTLTRSFTVKWLPPGSNGVCSLFYIQEAYFSEKQMLKFSYRKKK